MYRSTDQEVKKVLFEVTEDSLETGLRGIPVGYCVTSYADPEKGLIYAGVPIQNIISYSPERVIFLLYYGREGSDIEIETFTQQLYKRAKLSPDVVKHIENLPKRGDPMKHLAAALLFSGMMEKTGDYREDALNIIAKIPEITAHVINTHAGWGKTPPSRPQIGYMRNFAQMLRIPHPPAKNFPEILELFNILHYDHGGGNLSAFVGKAIASGLEDMFGSLSGAILALAGSRHGGANQECLVFVQNMLDKLGPDASLEKVEEHIRKMLAHKELIYGFGHAVLRVEDPRATIQYEWAQRFFSEDPLVKMAYMIRTQGSKVLKENSKIACPYPNVDAISGVLLSAAGFFYPQYFPLLFGLSRTVGIAIQIVYERLEAREGKGTPIIRPKYPYRGRVSQSPP